MTLCIAAPCQHESSPVIVMCADTRGAHGLVTSDDTDKFRVIGMGGEDNVSVLIAGEVTKANELVNECEVVIKSKLYSRVDPLDMDLYTTELLQLLRSAVRKRKKELIDEHLTLTTGWNMDEFMAVGKDKLVRDHYDQVWEEIRCVNLGAEMILPLLCENEAVIIVIEMSGRVVWVDHYGAIGTGANIADVVLSQREYNDEMPLMECLYRVFEAKVAAEKNPSVGDSTAFEIVMLNPAASIGPIRRKNFDISDACFRYLDRKVRGRKLPKLNFEEGFLELNVDKRKQTPLPEEKRKD